MARSAVGELYLYEVWHAISSPLFLKAVRGACGNIITRSCYGCRVICDYAHTIYWHGSLIAAAASIKKILSSTGSSTGNLTFGHLNFDFRQIRDRYTYSHTLLQIATGSQIRNRTLKAIASLVRHLRPFVRLLLVSILHASASRIIRFSFVALRSEPH